MNMSRDFSGRRVAQAEEFPLRAGAGLFIPVGSDRRSVECCEQYRSADSHDEGRCEKQRGAYCHENIRSILGDVLVIASKLSNDNGIAERKKRVRGIRAHILVN